MIIWGTSSLLSLVLAVLATIHLAFGPHALPRDMAAVIVHVIMVTCDLRSPDIHALMPDNFRRRVNAVESKNTPNSQIRRRESSSQSNHSSTNSIVLQQIFLFHCCFSRLWSYCGPNSFSDASYPSFSIVISPSQCPSKYLTNLVLQRPQREIALAAYGVTCRQLLPARRHPARSHSHRKGYQHRLWTVARAWPFREMNTPSPRINSPTLSLPSPATSTPMTAFSAPRLARPIMPCPETSPRLNLPPRRIFATVSRQTEPHLVIR